MDKFKIGDTVKVVYTEPGYINSYLGLTGEIIEMNDSSILLSFRNDEKWFLPNELELINE